MKLPCYISNTDDMDQWLLRPTSASNKSKQAQTSQDPLSAFKKMTISGQNQPEEPKTLFRLPPILTSDNAATWLATRKNKNDNNVTEKQVQNETKMAKTKAETSEDMNKWLLRSKTETKVETDLVTLTVEEPNPWLARSTITTTNLNNLPGKRTTTLFTLPAQFESNDPKDWLVQANQNKNENANEVNMNEWLWVPRSRTEEENKRKLLDSWFEKASTMSWTSSNSDSRVEEWLKNALEDATDDFDDCSIEIISQ